MEKDRVFWRAFKTVIVTCVMAISLSVEAGDIVANISNSDAGRPKDDCGDQATDHGPNGPSQPSANSHRGNPINVASGNKFHKEPLYVGAGEFPLEYSLYYNSYMRTNGRITGRWSASYSQHLTFDQAMFESGDMTKFALYREDGQVVYFEDTKVNLDEKAQTANPYDQAGSLIYIAPPESGSPIEHPMDAFGKFEYKRKDGFVETFDIEGQLTKITSPVGLEHIISYEYVKKDNVRVRDVGPRLCKSYGTIDSVVLAVFNNKSIGVSSVGETYSEAYFDGASNGLTCSEWGPNWSNWLCANSITTATGYACNSFRHKDSECTSRNPFLQVCLAMEEKYDTQAGVKYEKIVTVEDEGGRELKWTTTGTHALNFASVCDGCTESLEVFGGSTIAFTKTNDGMIKTIRDSLKSGAAKEFLYEVNNDYFSDGDCSIIWDCKTALTGVVDENKIRYATWEYIQMDGWPRANVSYHGVGDEIEDYSRIDYTDGHNRKVINALGREQTLNFTAPGGFIRLNTVTAQGGTNCSNSSMTYSYNGKGQVDRIIGVNNHTTDYTYYPDGKIETITEAKGRPEEERVYYSWHPDFSKKIHYMDFYEKGKPYKKVLYAYWDNGRIKSRSVVDLTDYTEPYETRARTSTASYAYEYADGTNRLSKITVDGPRDDVSDITVYDFNAQGLLASKVNALGHKTQYLKYTDEGWPLTIYDDYDLYFIEYTAGGQVRSLKREPEILYSAGYYDNGLLEWEETASTGRLTYLYTSARRLKSITDVDGNEVTIEHAIDSSNKTLKNITEILRDATGQVAFQSKTQLDSLSRPYKISAGSETTELNYDANNNLTGVTNARQAHTELQYNATHQPVKVIGAEGEETTFGYGNSAAREFVVQDGEGNKSVYNYNGFGNQLSVQSSAAGLTQSFHDLAGNTTKRIDGRGVESSLQYDALNRLTHIRYPAATQLNITFEYDSETAPDGSESSGKGFLTAMIDQSGRTKYGYEDGRLSQKSTTVGGVVSDVYYKQEGRRSHTITYPSGRVVYYNYKESGALQSIETATSAGEPKELIQSKLPLSLHTVYWDLGNGLVKGHVFDKSRKLYRWELSGNKSLVDKTYTYDLAGNINFIDDYLNSSSKEAFDYDLSNRLIWAKGLYGELDYTFDHVGNRTSKTQQEAGHEWFQEYIYEDDSNRLKTVEESKDDVPSSMREFFYDDGGNTEQQVQDGDILDYEYGSTNRLLSASQNGIEVARYTYNGMGQRVKAVFSDHTEIYTYNLQGQLLAILDDSGQTMREYVYAGQEKVAMFVYGHNEKVKAVDLTRITLKSFFTQDRDKQTSFLMADKSVTLSGNTWRETKRRFTITPQTHLEFDFAGDGKGEIQGIGLDENPLASSDRVFKLAGSQRWGIRDFNYTGAGATQRFSIPVGQYYTGSKLRLVLVNDNDSSSQEDGESTFSNVRLCEGPCPSRDVASITQELYFIHNDHLGTPKLMTGRNQEAVWSANSTPYGVLINEESSIGAENSRFIGQYFDVATGLHYNYFRDYDPNLGRYVQSDPIGLNGGINTYAYVGNNPLKYTDPTGLVRWNDLGSATLGLLGNGAGVVVGGALLGTPEPTLITKGVGAVVLSKSVVGWGLNSYNFGRAWSDDESYDAPSSAGRAIATAIDPCDTNYQRYADAAELGIDLLSGRLPVGSIPVAGSALDKAANFNDYHNYMKAGFGTSTTSNYIDAMQGFQSSQYAIDAYGK